MGINPKQINFPQAPHLGSQLPWISNVAACSEIKEATWRQGEIKETQFKATSSAPRGVPWSPWKYFPHVSWGYVQQTLPQTAQTATEIRGQADSHSRRRLLAILPVPIPPLRRALVQK